MALANYLRQNLLEPLKERQRREGWEEGREEGLETGIVLAARKAVPSPTPSGELGTSSARRRRRAASRSISRRRISTPKRPTPLTGGARYGKIVAVAAPQRRRLILKKDQR